MEGPLREEGEMKQEESSRRQKGGIRTMPFILANESFEKVASYGIHPNMIRYLMSDYHMGFAEGTNVLLRWSAATNFLPVIGAFLSDSLLGRFLTIFLGSIFSLLGMILLWLTTMIRDAKPPPCNPWVPHSCESPTPIHYTLLFSAFGLISIGGGGVHPCSLAFGADQIDCQDNPNRMRALGSFFGWYYATAIMAVMIAFTGIVYIQDHHGWRVGFGIPVVLMLLATIFFVAAYPLYYKIKVEKSVFTSFCQVILVAWKHRNLSLPDSSDGLWYNGNDAKVTTPTKTLRFLNKACIPSKPEDMNEDSAKDRWNICTVDQVEELKTLIKDNPVMVLQYNVIGDHEPNHISGLCFSIVAMVVSGVVEHVRKNKAIADGFINDSQSVITMSALWLIPQNVLNGLAEALNIIGQTEFYYSEFPKSMSSIASALYLLGLAIASLLASFLLSTVDSLTTGKGKESWISTNINKGQYDKYYWLLAIMSCINFLYYVVCSRAYGPGVDKTVVTSEESGENEASRS
ncbi:hypothetical protein SSX86_015492 [Deinandra increscens subsp. villosa]|uniref:Uncharacterized protein n=1 Tax=Deinandra increscens subsp. villosa TaxID=3103831 RepID=A0AAP0H136_9ASTR